MEMVEMARRGEGGGIALGKRRGRRECDGKGARKRGTRKEDGGHVAATGSLYTLPRLRACEGGGARDRPPVRGRVLLPSHRYPLPFMLSLCAASDASYGRLVRAVGRCALGTGGQTSLLTQVALSKLKITA